MNISVIIPTYRRTTDLCRCLKGIALQKRQPDEIIVVTRDTDDESRQAAMLYLSELSQLRIAAVCDPGVVAAMNAGLDQVNGDIVALTDDDAVPAPDWLERIAAHFEAVPQLAGVGGKDIVHTDKGVLAGEQKVVGKLLWWGDTVGGHHIGSGPPRCVDVLKGVNCAYRTSVLKAIRFDQRLRGTGAQVHWELSLGLSIRDKGLSLIYDPKVVVDHYPAQRHDEDKRTNFNSIAYANYIYNETLVMWKHLNLIQKISYIFWRTVIGTRFAPGVIQVLRLLVQSDSSGIKRFGIQLAARKEAIVTFYVHTKSRETMSC